MRKRRVIEIKEDLPTLKKLKRVQKNLRTEKRAYALICLKESKFSTYQELADHLYIHMRTLEKWLSQYESEGLEGFLTSKPKRKGSKIINEAMHQGLKSRVEDPNNPFLGYWDAQNWLNETFSASVEYHRVREYLIQHFKTRVKRPRKSHIKKDPQAKEAFFKTAQHLQQD